MSKKKSYFEKLKDPRWQKKRLEILERDNFTCRGCGEKGKTLHVHHAFYDSKYSDPWKYPTPSLWTLCEDCHVTAQNLKHDLQLEMAKINPIRLRDLLKVLIGFRESLGKDGNHEFYDFDSDTWKPKDFSKGHE